MASNVSGLSYIEDFITIDKESEIIKYIDTKDWNLSLKRRTQHYGYEYNYSSRSAETLAPPLEGPIKQVADVLAGLNVITPQQAIVNEYSKLQGIAAHTDAKLFGPVVVSLSLISPTNMIFSHPTHSSVSLTLMPRSIVILSGDARETWKHQIDPVSTVTMKDGTIYQKPDDYRRISVTYRTMT